MSLNGGDNRMSAKVLDGVCKCRLYITVKLATTFYSSPLGTA